MNPLIAVLTGYGIYIGLFAGIYYLAKIILWWIVGDYN